MQSRKQVLSKEHLTLPRYNRLLSIYSHLPPFFHDFNFPAGLKHSGTTLTFKHDFNF